MSKLENFCIRILLVWVLTIFYSAEKCELARLKCNSCAQDQKYNNTEVIENFLACSNGKVCSNIEKGCKTSVNCFTANECTGAGIFPDTISESKFYVCLSDSNSGFIKYEFLCLSNEYFDKSTLQCTPTIFTSTPSVDSTITESSLTMSAGTVNSDLSSVITLVPATDNSDNYTTVNSNTNASASTASSDKITYTSTTFLTVVPSPSPITPSISTTILDSSTATSITSFTPSVEVPTSSVPGFTTSSDISSTIPQSTLLTESTTEPSAQLNSTTVTTSTAASPTSTPTSKPFLCLSPGIFPDPSDCKIYYRCSTSLVMFQFTCPGTSYFNQNILKCSLVMSPSCQEQILKNTTTTQLISSTVTATPPASILTTETLSYSSLTSSLLTASTKLATQTSAEALKTTTITTSTSTPTPFSCSVAGIFPDPINCKTYFRCSTSGLIFKYSCPGISYFNELSKSCSLVPSPRCQKILLL